VRNNGRAHNRNDAVMIMLQRMFGIKSGLRHHSVMMFSGQQL
jgi:hypothetical protein